MKTSICAKFTRPVAIAVALALTTVSLPAQPAYALPRSCRALFDAYLASVERAEFSEEWEQYDDALYFYQSALDILDTYGELCS